MKCLRHSMRGWLAGATLAAVLLVASPSRADIDMNGGWFAEATVFGFTVDCNFSVTQVGTSWDANGSCTFGSLSLSGTIDPVTGVFSATGGLAFICPASLTLNGTASDNFNFTGTIDCAGFGGPIVGTRCGNSTIDPGEECDVGLNGSPDACCLEGCVLRPAGEACRPELQCVPAGFCDGVNGLCPYDPSPFDGTPCDEGNLCLENSTCSGGTCGNGTPVTAGTTCIPQFDPCFEFLCDGAGGCNPVANNDPCDDGTACTTNDTCSGGACVPGPPLECNPCETCSTEHGGCVADARDICEGPIQDGSTLTMRQGATPGDSRLRWRWLRGSEIDLLDFGAPPTGTSYTLCVYDEDPMLPLGRRVLAHATIPSANPSPNWSPTRLGYRYADRSAATDGVEAIILKSGAAGDSKIIFRAKGANLQTLSLPATPPILVQLEAGNGGCWQAEYTATSVNREDKLSARGGL